MKKLLQTTLQTATWPPSSERDKVKSWIKEIGERVKERMLGTFVHASLLVVVPHSCCQKSNLVDSEIIHAHFSAYVVDDSGFEVNSWL